MWSEKLPQGPGKAVACAVYSRSSPQPAQAGPGALVAWPPGPPSRGRGGGRPQAGLTGGLPASARMHGRASPRRRLARAMAPLRAPGALRDACGCGTWRRSQAAWRLPGAVMARFPRDLCGCEIARHETVRPADTSSSGIVWRISTS